MPGEEFFRSLMRIWLGENPAQEDLKEALLGQPRRIRRLSTMIARILLISLCRSRAQPAPRGRGRADRRQARVGDAELRPERRGPAQARVLPGLRHRPLPAAEEPQRRPRSSQPGPKRVAIHMLRDVGADTFTEALADGIRAEPLRSRSEGARAAHEAARRHRWPRSRKRRRAWPSRSTGTARRRRCCVDGKPAGQPIDGEDFYRALLRIWLGDKPVQDDLKKALLGGLMAHYDFTTPLTEARCAQAARERHRDAATARCSASATRRRSTCSTAAARRASTCAATR